MQHSVLIKYAKLSALIVTFAMTAISCKKKEEDDPNITYISINKTLTTNIANEYKYDTIDVFGDNRNLIVTQLIISSTGDSSNIVVNMANGGIYTDPTQLYFVYKKLQNLFTGNTPELLPADKWANNGFAAVKLGTDKRGYIGVGDVFIPVIFTRYVPTIEYHYGWLRIDISSDARSIKLLDLAYDIRPDTAVKMGAK